MIARGLPLLTLLVLMGCASQEAPKAQAAATDGTKVVGGKYVDASGKPFCPVMKTSIESEEKAAGKLTHEGVTYFVCCDPCIKKFKDSPAQYAAK